MPKMYSHNKLTNPSAETGDLTGWTASGVTVETGGTDGSKCFKLADTANMYQEISFTSQPPDFRVGADFMLGAEPNSLAVAVKSMLKVEYFYSDGTIDMFIFPFRADVPSSRDLGNGWIRVVAECDVRQGVTLQTVRVTAMTGGLAGGVYLDRFILRENLLPAEETEFEPPEEEVEEKENPSADVFGINDEYLDYYPNKCYNSSFEIFNTATKKPDFWDTDGEVSPDANFSDTYSLKLASGKYAEQKEDAGGAGLADPGWWSWCPDTRFSFRAKGGGQVKVSVLQGGSAVPLWAWKEIDGEWVKICSEAPHSLLFDVASDWHEAMRTFAATPGSGKIKLRFENVGSSDVYLDAVIIRPDWTGRWPGLYKHGPSGVVVINEFIEYGSASWDSSGVEFILENAYTDMPVVNEIGVTCDNPAQITGAFRFAMKFIKETVNGVANCYSKIQATPKGTVPSSLTGGKVHISAICTGVVFRA